MTTFNLPDLGEGLTEATLLSWLVAEGETIVVDQPIAEVETAKSAIEVPSPYAGVVTTLHGAVGETMIVDEPLITVGAENEAGSSPGSSSAGSEPGALSYREEERAGTVPATGAVTDPEAAGAEDGQEEGSGNVLIGYGTSASKNGRRRRRRNGTSRPGTTGGAAAPAAAPSTQSAESSRRGAAFSTSDAAASAISSVQKAPRVSSPLVRRLAREHGLPLAELTGTGPDGMILRADVLAAIDSPVQTAPSPASQAGAASGSAPAPATGSAAAPISSSASMAGAPAPGGLEVRERAPMSGMRKAVATTLTRSRREIPEATVWQDVDMTEVLALRSRLKEQSQKDGTTAPSLLALLSRFVLAGLSRYPDLATRLEDTAAGTQEIVHYDGVNLGFAAQTPAGLVVPVIRHAERLSARGLHGEISRLVGEAREGKISGKELTGGTFTVNNYGVFGSDGATPIINHPEVGILGIGRILDRAWVVNGELAVRKVATLTIAFDHRVCDGGTAGGFLNFVATCLEDPSSALADL
ncbi:dihydrolipoamide acetyltransferase family protein [Nesterenkonia jeotgali]|uniref:Dihydrolipoamide acetyltransferase component of pyruvate dehydrogenase complex n=1 Tax=Nesterenkonia jeotgali TaxID=317018 RepID=A0A0W8IFS1_9MICC|nr:dihydrolipoamide acetyltransferase family protein [Nesterenkonia jeotgali]KUG58624.1 branched-chain alpha-keto acid dehydrogenase subunit E2 [Nesterenkonia jeotgali]